MCALTTRITINVWSLSEQLLVMVYPLEAVGCGGEKQHKAGEHLNYIINSR